MRTPDGAAAVPIDSMRPPRSTTVTPRCTAPSVTDTTLALMSASGFLGQRAALARGAMTEATIEDRGKHETRQHEDSASAILHALSVDAQWRQFMSDMPVGDG